LETADRASPPWSPSTSADVTPASPASASSSPRCGPDYADTQVAEIFLHHRVLIVPVIDHGRVSGIITRESFFRSLTSQLAA
jgi:hypothetical protein